MTALAATAALSITGLVAVNTPAAMANTCTPTAIDPANPGNYGGGLGTPQSPWLICHRTHLEGIATNLTGSYLLSSNLDLGGIATPWAPIVGSFAGTLDGAHRFVEGIHISGSGVRLGLFETLSSNSEVINLGLSGEIVSTQTEANVAAVADLSDSYQAGLLAGHAFETTVENVFVGSSKISGPTRIAGGLVGYAEDSSLKQLVVKRVDIEPAGVTGQQTYYGGLMGYGLGNSLSRASTAGNIKGDGVVNSSILLRGGMVGWADFSMDQVQSSISIQDDDASAYTGGLVGRFQTGLPVVSNSVYTGGTLPNDLIVGAMAGANATAKFVTSYTVSTVPAATSSNHGPWVGFIGTDTENSSSFFNLDNYGTDFTADTKYKGGIAKSTASLQATSTFTNAGWKIAETGSPTVTTNWSLTGAVDAPNAGDNPIWRITENVDYPRLVWLDHFDNQFVQLSYDPAAPSVPENQDVIAAATLPAGAPTTTFSLVDNSLPLSIDQTTGEITNNGAQEGDSFIVEVSAQQASRGLDARVFLPITITAATAAPNATNPAYNGPTVTNATSAAPGNQVTITGTNLATVSRVEIDGIAINVTNPGATSFSFTLPAGITPGLKDLRLISSFGQITIQSVLRVLGSQANTSTPGYWTKGQPNGTEIKFYARNPIGQGKIQFFVDGREVAWIRTTDATDPKLTFAIGNSYLVRTIELKPGKNRLEIRVNDQRVWRATYTR